MRRQKSCTENIKGKTLKLSEGLSDLKDSFEYQIRVIKGTIKATLRGIRERDTKGETNIPINQKGEEIGKGIGTVLSKVIPGPIRRKIKAIIEELSN